MADPLSVMRTGARVPVWRRRPSRSGLGLELLKLLAFAALFALAILLTACASGALPAPAV